MGNPRVCVIDSSPVVRETVSAVLGATCVVEAFDADAAERTPPPLDTVLFLIEERLLSAATIDRLAGQAPILWMSTTASPSRGNQSHLARFGSPIELLDAVTTALNARGAAADDSNHDPDLATPRLDADAAHIAAVLANTDLPCLISGEPGCGKMRVARALHRCSGAARFVSLAADSWPADLAGFTTRWKGPLTLCVGNVDRLSRGAQRWLLDVIEAGGWDNDSGFQRVRVIAQTRLDPRALQRLADFDRTLELRLGTMSLELKPLRERADDIAALVAAVALDTTKRLRRPVVSFSERAITRLTHYTWPGNLAELESVVARSVALCDVPRLDVDDLQFGFAAPRVSTVRPASPEPRLDDSEGVAVTAGAPTTPSLTLPPAELIIQELCHEFRNPMSTIKTIGQHIDRLMENPEGRVQLAQLTGEAIERMDRVLDGLVRFTEFGVPERSNVAINAVLGPAVRELAPTLTERHLVLNYQPADAGEAVTDPDQLSYAVTHLLEAVIAELEEGGTLNIRPALPSPAFAIEFKTSRRSTVESLQTWLDSSGDAAPTWLPLGILLGRSVIEKNGGRLSVEGNEGRTVLTVHLPSAKGNTEYGEASRSHSGR